MSDDRLRPGRAQSPCDPIQTAALRLARARATRTTTKPVRDLLAAGDVEAAYAVQQAFVDDQVARGARITGRKIGLTAPAVQAQLGVDEPDFGVLLDTMKRREDEEIDLDALLQPKIEAEIAFTLGADIADVDADTDVVRAAVAFAQPALEIVDSRIAEWDISLVDTIADNASSALYVLGAAEVSLDDFDPSVCRMRMSIDGCEVSSGSGDACLGDPLNALAWLARTAARLGQPLAAGQIVLSGALGPMAPLTPGAQVTAVVSGLGSVSATVSQPATTTAATVVS